MAPLGQIIAARQAGDDQQRILAHAPEPVDPFNTIQRGTHAQGTGTHPGIQLLLKVPAADAKALVEALPVVPKGKSAK